MRGWRNPSHEVRTVPGADKSRHHVAAAGHDMIDQGVFKADVLHRGVLAVDAQEIFFETAAPLRCNRKTQIGIAAIQLRDLLYVAQIIMIRNDPGCLIDQQDAGRRLGRLGKLGQSSGAFTVFA